MPGQRSSGGSKVRTVTPIIRLAIALLHSAVLPSTTLPSTNLSEVAPVVCGEGVEDYLSCRTEYPTGCNATGKYDAYLNEFKNRRRVDLTCRGISDGLRYVCMGGHGGNHTILNMNTLLLGGADRPSLY